MRLLAKAGLLAWTLSVLAPAAASADMFAAVNVAAPAPRTDLDIAIVNASLGKPVGLPAGVNTPADETHPSISSNGRRLTFQRSDAAAGTVKIVVVDLSTGESANLFADFETSEYPPTDPAITPDGRQVGTGGPFHPFDTSLFSQLTLTRLTLPLLNGPFRHGAYRPQYGFNVAGQVADVAAGGLNLFAFQQTRPGTNGQVVLGQLGFSASYPIARADTSYANPALAAKRPQFVAFDSRPVAADGSLGQGSIVWRPATPSTFTGPPRALPAIVNSELDESQPAVTADGRYIAFVRHLDDGHDRLFIWDSKTRILLNPDGVDMGAVVTRDRGAVSLYKKPVFKRSSISRTGAVTAALLRPATLDIFVQRIVGTTRLLGSRAYKLEPVGRARLGTFGGGRLRRMWNLRAGGEALAPGRYLVTLRARKGSKLRELANPHVVRIRG